RTPDQTLDLARATSERSFAPIPFLAALGVGARMHLILGGEPADPSADQEIRHRFVDGGGDEHARLPRADHGGAFRILVKARDDVDGSNLVERSPAALAISHAPHVARKPSPVMQDSTLRVSEFFCSIQGEGISAGARCLFVRLATCNLRCSFCDTPYSWDFTRYDSDQEVQKLEIGELARRIAGAAEGRLVLTGGEPLIQQDGLVRLVALLPERLIIEVETNGTLAPCPELLARVDQWNVSPKLSNSGEPQRRRLLPAVLARFA